MSFDITLLPRSTPRDQWNKFWHYIRKYERPSIEDKSTIAERARFVDLIHGCAEHGRIAVNIDQMDCDCCRYTSSGLIPAHPFAFESARQRAYLDAEGPIYGFWISKPSEQVPHESRDLALEAFEDGHPSVISMARFDEDGPY